MDGFNLYYGALKGTEYKWLDIRALMERVVPASRQIGKIKYFTAEVLSRTNNPGVRARQEIYLRALSAYDHDIEIIKGRYAERAKKSPLLTPGDSIEQRDLARRRKSIARMNTQIFNSTPSWAADPGPPVHVINSEEKGTDVNLGVHILNDAWLDKYDCCVVVSNDSDLAEACRLVRERGKEVIVVRGFRAKRAVAELQDNSHLQRKLRKAALQASQLPSQIPSTSLSKPKEWS